MATTLDGRSRLDSSLFSAPLDTPEGVLGLVRNHLLKSGWSRDLAEVAEHHSLEVWQLLESLRSVCGEKTAKLLVTDDHGSCPREWKLKQETDVMRVMYREGPEGTPYHTYCVDGIVNGPMVNAVCVAWEAPSYKEWWPQVSMPTFKILDCQWLKRISIGEDLSRIRVKVPWPLATREVLMRSFELEFLENDTIIVLLGTAPSELNDANENALGFTMQELPMPSSNTVRIDIAGGFILQRQDSNQSYFRTILDMDIKLDIIPPWVINFITRQLVGLGYKLYQKTVLEASSGQGSGKVFRSLIENESMYRRIMLELKEREQKKSAPKNKLPGAALAGQTYRVNAGVENRRVVPLDETLREMPLEEPACNLEVHVLTTSDSVASSSHGNLARNTPKFEKSRSLLLKRLDPEVEQALKVLDNMIASLNSLKTASPSTSSKQKDTLVTMTETKEALKTWDCINSIEQVKFITDQNGERHAEGESEPHIIEEKHKEKLSVSKSGKFQLAILKGIRWKQWFRKSPRKKRTS